MEKLEKYDKSSVVGTLKKFKKNYKCRKKEKFNSTI